MWTPAAPGFALPCRTSSQAELRGGTSVVVRDAVHVALTARWQDAGWAAAQVWPDGMPMAAESMGRLSRRDPAAATAPKCALQLVVLDEPGSAGVGGLGRYRLPTRGSWLSRWGAPRCRAE